MREAFEDRLYQWPGVSGRRVLLVGVGGGSDILSAYALSTLLDVGPAGLLVWGNTKTRREPDLIPLGAHIARLPEAAKDRPGAAARAAHGTTGIDRGVPRGALGCPLIFFLPDEPEEAALSGEIKALGFDLVIAVDTGGDALGEGRRGKPGRDRRMLRVLRAVGVELRLAVLAPGSDGQQDAAAVAALLEAERRGGRYLGYFSLAPLLPLFAQLSAGLSESRTPRIILRAAASGAEEVEVPRGKRPRVPRRWLTGGFMFG